MDAGKYPRPRKLASLSRLRETWAHSRDSGRRSGSAGVDGITPSRFREHLDRNLHNIHKNLVAGTYEFSNLRPLPIPKESGGYRVICIPTVSDRLVQRLIVRTLVGERDRLGVKNSVSYGFIEGQGGVVSALRKARNLRAEHPWVFKSDISSFFDQIDRSDLKEQLNKRLGRWSLAPLINAAIDCEIEKKGLSEDELESTKGIRDRHGLRQGMPLSPILSNFVLRDFDRFFEKRNAKLIRYADDFLILTDSREQCEEFFQHADRLLKQKGHSIPSPSAGSKTAFRSPDEPVEFLGLEISPKRSAAGYEIRAGKKAFQAIRRKLELHSNFESALREGKRFFEVISRINSSVVGYVNVYRDAKNFEDLRSHAETCRANAIARVLCQLFGPDAMENLKSDYRKAEFLGLSDGIAHQALSNRSRRRSKKRPRKR